MRSCWLILLVFAGCPARSADVERVATRPATETVSVHELFATPKLAATTTTSTAPCRKINADATLAYMEGRSALVGGQPDAAEEHLERALKIDPRYVDARRLLAEMHFDRGQFALAKEHALKLVEQVPDDITGQYVLGSILLRAGQLNPGGEHLYHAIVLSQRSGQERSATTLLARFVLGQALANRDYVQAAIDVYEPLVTYLDEYDPSAPPRDARLRKVYVAYRPGFYLLLADFYCRLGQMEQAECYYLKAERIPATRQRAYSGLIECYRKMGQMDKARAVLAQLMASGAFGENVIGLYRQLYPGEKWVGQMLSGYEPAHENLQVGLRMAEELIKRRHHAAAAELLDRLVELDPSDGNVLWLAVSAYQELGRLDRCAELLIDELAGGTHSSSCAVGFVSRWDVSTARALSKALERLEVSADRQFAKAYLSGLIAQNEGLLELAEQQYRRAGELDESFLPAHLARGNLLVLQRRWREAIELVDGVVEENPATGGLLYVKGRAQAELDMLEDAIATLTDARKLNPQSDQIGLALAEAYVRAGEVAPAVRILEEAIKAGLTGYETLSEMVQTLFHADNLPLAQRILERYRQRFGADAQYTLLQAKLEYQQGLDRVAYRKQLEELFGKTARPAQARIELAELEYQCGQYRQVTQMADDILDSFELLWPRDYQRIMQLKALSHHRLLEYDPAEQTWRAILSDWPNRERFKTAVGKMYLDAQRFDRAVMILADLLEGARTDRQRSHLRGQMVYAMLGQDDLAGAVDLIRSWLDSAPSDQAAGLYGLLLDCYMTRKQYDQAVKLLTGLLASGSKPQRRWQRAMSRVLALRGEGERGLAMIDSWMTEAEQEQDRGFIEGLKIPVYLEMKRFDDAIKLAQRRRQLATGYERLSRALVLITCCQRAKRYDHAEYVIREQLKKYPSQSPGQMDFHYQLVRTWQLAGRFDQAEEYIKEQLEAASGADRAEWQQLLVGLYFASQQRDKAVIYLESLLSRGGDVDWAANSLGYCLADMDRQLERAETLIRTALASDPGNAAYLDSLAWVLYRSGEYAQAEKYALMARRAMPVSDPVVLDHLGDIVSKLGRVDEARGYWREALREAQQRDSVDTEPNLRERLLEKLKGVPSVSGAPNVR